MVLLLLLLLLWPKGSSTWAYPIRQVSRMVVAYFFFFFHLSIDCDLRSVTAMKRYQAQFVAHEMDKSLLLFQLLNWSVFIVVVFGW